MFFDRQDRQHDLLRSRGMWSWLGTDKEQIDGLLSLISILAILVGGGFAGWKLGFFRTLRINVDIEVGFTSAWNQTNDLMALSVTVKNIGQVPVQLPDHTGHRIRVTTLTPREIALSLPAQISMVWDAAPPTSIFLHEIDFGGTTELKAGQQLQAAAGFVLPTSALAAHIDVDVVARRSWGRASDSLWKTSTVVIKQ